MITSYCGDEITIGNDTGSFQVICKLSKTDIGRFTTAMHGGAKQVEFFAVENMSVCLRPGYGVMILGERVPLRQKGW